VPLEGLSESLIDPAVAWLHARGCEVVTGRRVTGLRIEAGRVSELVTAEGPVPVEAVVLAVPPWVVADLLPGQTCPNEFQAILNIHFRVEADPGPAGFTGLVGGVAEWVFVKRGHVSVTISAANRMVDQDAEAIARAVWPDVAAATGPQPGCPARSKVPSGPAEPRPRRFSPPEDARCRVRRCCRTRPRRTHRWAPRSRVLALR
jgi:hypothetical protein